MVLDGLPTAANWMRRCCWPRWPNVRRARQNLHHPPRGGQARDSFRPLPGKTTGAPLAAIIRNENTAARITARSSRFPRPRTAITPPPCATTAANDPRGADIFPAGSPRPCAGRAICHQILSARGIESAATSIRLPIYSIPPSIRSACRPKPYGRNAGCFPLLNPAQ
jgi:hypothetical protein